jgi:hypothetical protein
LGIFFSICVATTGLFLFVDSIPALKSIEPKEAKHNASITSTGVFFLGATLTKLVVPLLASSDFLVMTIVAVVYMFIFAAFLLFWNSLVWKKYKRACKTMSNVDHVRLRNKYNRITNSIVLLALLIGIDGADIMFLLNLLLSFLSEIVMLLAMLLTEFSKLTFSLLKILRKESGRFELYLQTKKLKNFDDWLWSLPSYSGKFLKGVPLLLFGFVGCFPFIFLSYQIDFFHLDLVLLLGMTIFSIPGFVSILAVRIPWRIGKGSGPKWRKRLMILSFALPACVIIIGYVFPNLAFDLAFPPSILFCIVLFIGLPLLYATTCAEHDDYEGTLKWFRILGISPLPVFAIANLEAARTSLLTGNDFLGALLLGILASLFGTSVFNLLMHYTLVTQFEEGWKELDGKQVDYWLHKIFDPGLNFDTFISIVGIGALQGFLNLIILGILGNGFAIFLNMFISFAVGFGIGWILQHRSEKRYWGSIWIASFHISSSFLSMLFTVFVAMMERQISLIQWLIIMIDLFVFAGIWAAPIGTITALLILRHK